MMRREWEPVRGGDELEVLRRGAVGFGEAMEKLNRELKAMSEETRAALRESLRSISRENVLKASLVPPYDTGALRRRGEMLGPAPWSDPSIDPFEDERRALEILEILDSASAAMPLESMTFEDWRRMVGSLWGMSPEWPRIKTEIEKECWVRTRRNRSMKATKQGDSGI